MGKSTINGHFPLLFWHNQRVQSLQPHWSLGTVTVHSRHRCRWCARGRGRKIRWRHQHATSRKDAEFFMWKQQLVTMYILNYIYICIQYIRSIIHIYIYTQYTYTSMYTQNHWLGPRKGTASFKSRSRRGLWPSLLQVPAAAEQPFWRPPTAVQAWTKIVAGGPENVVRITY